MTHEQSFQNEHSPAFEEALAAISAVNAELISFQASEQAFGELGALKDRLEAGESAQIIMKEAEDLRDLAQQAHESKDSLDIAA